MSALDRLQNYSATKKSMSSDVFDTSTPEGYFLAKLHQQGYLMYEYYYEDASLGRVLSEDKFNWLSDEEKGDFEKKFRYTELHDMLVTSGDQLVLANAGSGKALANDTKVLTKDGYKPIGQLTTDDFVFGTDLQLHKVLGVFPQGKKKVNALTISTSDESFTENCCDEHLWSIQSKTGIEVISTKDVIKRLETETTLPLVNLTSFDYDSTSHDAVLTFEEKCIVAFKLIASFSNGDNEIARILHNYYNNTDERISITPNFSDEEGMLLKRYTQDVLCCEGVAYEYKGSLIVNREVISEIVCTGTYKVNKSFDYLIDFARASKDDFTRVFNKQHCSYEITNVEETESEVEMTCIEVGSDNHLFLIEHLIPTHNTTALIFKIMHDIITGEATKVTSIPNGNSVRVVDDIFVGTFLKTGADELSERLAYWQRGLGYTVTADRVNFSTLHAEFKRALNSMGASTPIGSSAEINKCMRKAIDNLGITNCGSALTAEDYNIIGGIITYYRGRLDSKRYSHPSAYDYGLTPTLLDRLVSDFANQRQLAGIMDFEDLQELLYKFLYVTPNKAVQDFCANRYKYIYLDEFQDTSQIQYAIMKFYARGRLWMNRGTASEEDEKSPLYTGDETLGKIVVVGDNDQCVVGDTMLRVCYDWDGAEEYYGVKEYKTDESSIFSLPKAVEGYKTWRDVPSFVPIRDIKKGEYICCADNKDMVYSGYFEDEKPNKYGFSSEIPATLVLEEPLVHRRKNIDLYKIKVQDYTGTEWVDLELECTGDHILFTDNKDLSIPTDLYNTLIDGTEKGSVEQGYFTLETGRTEQFTMVFAKDLSVGDNVLLEVYGGCLVLREILSIEKNHYDEVEVYDIRTDARNYSANSFISHNCLYQWRGSDNAIIETEFDHDFRPCQTSLSYNYRCPSNILNSIVPSIKLNKGHEKREYHSSREGGISRGYHFSSYKGMLNQLIADIDEDMQEGNTVAILCRTNYDGVIPAFILESAKKYNFSISGQNMTFDSPLPRKLVAITSIFTERNTTNVKNTLSMFVPRYAQWGVKQLVDTLKNNGKNVWTLPEVDIEYSCPELAPMIKQIKSMFYENGKRNQSKELEALKFVYFWVMKNAFGGNSLYCESARAYIEALLLLLNENKFETVFDFVDYINTVNERLHARINNQKANICIATVHEFKGKERDSVIVWNDSDQVFPSSKTNIENEDELEGERMVHYVACTRARKKNTIYTIYGKEGMFVKEMDLQFESPQPIRGTLKSDTETKDLSDDEKNLLDVMQNLKPEE